MPWWVHCSQNSPKSVANVNIGNAITNDKTHVFLITNIEIELMATNAAHLNIEGFV